MPPTKVPNKSITDFFKPRQANSEPPSATLNHLTSKAQSLPPPPPLPPARSTAMGQSATKTTSSLRAESYTSSISPPPSSNASETFHTPREEPENESPNPGPSATPQKVHSDPALIDQNPPHSTPSPQDARTLPAPRPRDMIIQNSDDDDSDGSLQDLSTIFGKKPTGPSRSPIPAKTPSTPQMSRYKKVGGFHASPLTVQPKYKFDLRTLAMHREDEDSLEISSKRVKSMLAPVVENENTTMVSIESSTKEGLLARDALIASVVADSEDGEGHKVKRALLRTEAIVQDKRWYFFDPTSELVGLPDSEFPSKSIPDAWESELYDPEMRNLSFTSGFIEDLVLLGKTLPDELFMWMLDELCWEPTGQLRTSYLNVLMRSRDQVHRLFTPAIIQKLFKNLGGSSKGVVLLEKIVVVQKLDDPYPGCQWECLLSVIKLLGDVAKSLSQSSRTCAMTMLLRMSADRVVFENVDILVEVQKSIDRFCKYTARDSSESWEQACQDISASLFSTIDPSSLRVQLLESIPSTSPLSHDLRRRLAMCFFFEDLTYSKEHSHSLMELEKFMDRLEDSVFTTGQRTDYRELAALSSLLDVAVDDGRSNDLDLSDKAVEKKYNEDVEELSTMVKDIMRSIGNPGAAFISKIEAKERLDLLSQRIADGIRSKPKPRKGLFDGIKGRREEDLEKEKSGMASFVTKMKAISNKN